MHDYYSVIAQVAKRGGRNAVAVECFRTVYSDVVNALVRQGRCQADILVNDRAVLSFPSPTTLKERKGVACGGASVPAQERAYRAEVDLGMDEPGVGTDGEKIADAGAVAVVVSRLSEVSDCGEGDGGGGRLATDPAEVGAVIVCLVRRVWVAARRMETRRVTEAHYLHQYLYGLANLSVEAAGLIHLAGEPEGEQRASGTEGGKSEYERSREILANIAFGLECETYNALNVLSQLLPGCVPGVERDPPMPGNPMTAVRDVLPAYERQASARRICIEFDDGRMEAEMPAVLLRKGAYLRLWYNLLTNAIKYSYHGICSPGTDARERTIRVWGQPRHDERGRQCAISIQNYGIGIEADEIRSVCKPGYRGRLAMREVEIGCGLGLAEAQALAKAHGGRMRITSFRVHGDTFLTTVRLVLPVHGQRLR